MPTVSHSWKASWPIAWVGTCPLMITSGIESMYAVAMPVTALVTPGPLVTSATPIRLLDREYASAACTAACSCRDQDVLEPILLEDLVVDIEDRTAGIPEDVVDSFFLQTPNDDLGARELCGFHFRAEGLHGLSSQGPSGD